MNHLIMELWGTSERSNVMFAAESTNNDLKSVSFTYTDLMDANKAIFIHRMICEIFNVLITFIGF